MNNSDDCDFKIYTFSLLEGDVPCLHILMYIFHSLLVYLPLDKSAQSKNIFPFLNKNGGFLCTQNLCSN